MEVMDRKTRRQMSLDARKYGGIAIPHIKLQVHQNGAKFPISKVYIDDEQLDPNMYYTLIIVPEGARLSQQEAVIVLVVFDPKLGPDILETIPEGGLSKEAKDSLIGWFDTNEKPGYFTASTGKQFGFNLAFEVPHKTRAGGKAIFMLSLVTDSKQSTYVEDLVESVLENNAATIRKELTMYYASINETKKDLTDAEKGDLKKEEKVFHEKISQFLRKTKADIDRTLEIQEKMYSLGSQPKQ